MTDKLVSPAVITYDNYPLRSPSKGLYRFLRTVVLTLLPAWRQELWLAWKARNTGFNAWYFRAAYAPRTLGEALAIMPAVQSLRDTLAEGASKMVPLPEDEADAEPKVEGE